MDRQKTDRKRRVGKKDRPDNSELAVSLFDRALKYVALAGVYGALLAIVVATDATAYPHVFLKSLLLQGSLALTIPAFLVLVWRQPSLRPRRSWLSLAIAAYFAALVLSCAFAFHRYRAFWGSQDRMGGLFSLTGFFVWYVMASSLLRSWRAWRRLLHWQLMLGVVVAISALAEMGDPTIGRIAGVLGNPIYTGTYQLFMIGIATLLWVSTRSVALRTLYALVAVLSLMTLLGTGSRGPFLGLLSGLTAAALMWTAAGRHWRFLGAMAASVALAAVGYAVLVKLEPSWPQHLGLQHLFTRTTYELRPMIWATAWAGFRARPFFGWGLDGYEAVWDAHVLPRSICGTAGDVWTDTAHSLLFEHLSTTGALGTLTFAALWIVLAWSLLRALRQRHLEPRVACVLVSLSLAYLVQGQFITDSPSSHMMLFLLLAVACATGFPEFAAKNAPAAQPLAMPAARLKPWAILMALQSGALLLAWHTSVLPIAASHASLQSKTELGRGCGALLTSARYASAKPTPWTSDRLTVLSQALRDLAKEDQLGTCSEWRELYDLTRHEADVVYAGQPEHFRYRGILAALTLILGLKTHDPGLIGEAQRLYEALIAGSPQQQFFRFQLARLLAETGRAKAAEEQLLAAVAADPTMGEPLWRLGTFRWLYEDQAQSGSRLIVEASEGICHHPLASAQEAVLLAQAFWIQGDLAGLRSLEQRMEEIPPEIVRPAAAYREIARFQEQAGLLAECDHMLRLAAAKDGNNMGQIFTPKIAS